MHSLRFLLLILPLTTLALAGEPPTEAKLLFEDDFRKGADRWQPSDANAWKVIDTGNGKAYSQFRQSDYKPPHRSPLNLALVKDLVVGDLVLEAQVRSTSRDYDHRDMCLFFGYQDASHFYYVHFGKKTDDHANQIFIVNGAPRQKISTKTSDGTPWDSAWHRVKVLRRIRDGSTEVYFDDMKTPVMTARDKTFLHGQVGIGSFDDTGDWTKVKVYGTRMEKAR